MCKEDIRLARKRTFEQNKVTAAAGATTAALAGRGDRASVTLAADPTTLTALGNGVLVGNPLGDGTVFALAVLTGDQPSITLTIDHEGPPITQALSIRNPTAADVPVYVTETYWTEDLKDL